jgi:transposase-like protein
MRVMFNVTNPARRMHTMTKRESKAELIDWKGLLSGDPDYLRTIVEAIVQATLEAQMTAALGAEKGERTAARLAIAAAKERTSKRRVLEIVKPIQRR